MSISPNVHESLFDADIHIIVEILKTTKIFEYVVRNVIPMCRNASQSYWEVFSGEYEMLEDRIRLRTKYYKYFTVIARFSPPTASVLVDPSVSDSESQAIISVPELPGFKVKIPINSVQYLTEVKATLYYNTSEMSENSNETMATACVELEPHGSQFMENISIQIPIPSYLKVKNAHPNARLEVLYSPSGSSNEWIVQKDVKIDVSSEGEFCATFNTKTFSMWKFVWKSSKSLRNVVQTIGTVFQYVKSLSSHCQVFMSHESEKTSGINFSVQVWVYPFSDPSNEIPANYHYIIHDSGKIPIELTPGDLHFTLKLKDCLFTSNKAEQQKALSKSHTISEKFPARAEFDIDLEKESKTEFQDGAVFAYLVIKDDNVKHDCNLIKVIRYSK